MIQDLFSHKIHSSGEEWEEKLTELAAIFLEFDGQMYDRDLIERRLSAISPRSSFAARDASKFRDEFSAYQSYFGLYRLELVNGSWHLFLSETAKRYLTVEEPDVASFLRLQMALFQYPCGMGGAYRSNSNKMRIQANARDRTLDMINNGVHLSPLRLIVQTLNADSEIKHVHITQAAVTVKEIFALANNSPTNKKALPSLGSVKTTLVKVRKGVISAPSKYERRFHLLNHLGLFEVDDQVIKVRKTVSEADAVDVERKLSALLKIDAQYNGFDTVTNGRTLESAIVNGEWGRYFDGVATLSSDIVEQLTSDIIFRPEKSVMVPRPIISVLHEKTALPVAQVPVLVPGKYPLKEREQGIQISHPMTRQRELADPEMTRIKRQRRNLAHKILMEKTDKLLRSLGAIPLENDHIDLYAKIPQDGAFLFEIKSGGENLLDQVRKGLSQLYEYRFRYRDELHADLHLCMVLPDKPDELLWIVEYLCVDRKVCLCWFENDELKFPEQCTSEMVNLIPSS